jgi:hypothetical protein
MEQRDERRPGYDAAPLEQSETGRANQDEVRRIVDSLPGLIFTYDAAGRIEFVNGKLLAYLGCSRERLITWERADVVHPEDIERITRACRDNLSAGTSHEYEKRLRRADGIYHWFQLQCSPSFDADGRIIRWYGCLTDIDALKQAEHSSREDLHSLSHLLDRVPGLVFTKRANGELEWINRTILEYFGRSLEDLQGWQMTDAIHPDDLPATIARVREGATRGQSYELEHRLRRHDGVYRWFHYRAEPLHDEQGSLVRWYGLVTDIDDLKRAQEQARENERQLRLILDNIPGSVYTLNPNGEMEQVNQQILNFYGASSLDELRDWTRVTHPDDIENARARLTHALTTGTVWESEARGLRADGVYRWFQSRGMPLRDAEGHIVRWYCVNVDIDDLKRTQEEARENERELQLILDNIPGSVFTLTPAGEMEQVNQHILDYFGKTFEELRDWTKVTHPDDVESVRVRMEHALDTGTPWESSSRALRADGVYRWWQTRGLPLRNSEGRIIRWYCTNADIDDLKRAQEQARENEGQLRLILDNIPGYAYTMTAGGEMEQVNRQILDFFGKPFEELSDWSSVTHPDDIDKVRARLAHAFATGTPWESEARGLRSDGVYRWFQSRGLPLRDSNGRILRWYCMLAEIDDLKRAEEGIRSIQARLSKAAQLAAVSELAASIAHEINQPLAAVIANGHACHRWLAAEPPNVERALLSVQRTIRDGSSAADIVARIRALFRHAAPTKQSLCLNEVIEEVARVIADDLHGRGVSLRLELQQDLPDAAVDRVQMQQVIANLARNGIEAMERIEGRQKELSIASSHVRGEIIVEIKDVGVGLKGDEAFFEPFVTTKVNGMGMGLAICKTILDAHGGRLWALPNATVGATFAFALPTRALVEVCDSARRY